MIINFKTDDKPNLSKLLQENPQQAREIMDTFFSLIDKSIEQGWYYLPKQLVTDGSLTFKQLVHGILHGTLDLPDINPDAYDALGIEVHPLSLMSPREDYLNKGSYRYTDWRKFFKLDKDTPINQATIATILRRLLRYARYVNIQQLADALRNNQIATFRSLDQAKLLPFQPALKYQQETKGDLHVGKFFDDIGAFDCGTTKEVSECPACRMNELSYSKSYKVCLACNAGFKRQEE